MIRTLADRRRPAAIAGAADSLIVFLHGYGADGADLLGLADALAPHLPRTAFAAPDAPQRNRANPAGFQWFPVPWIDGSDPVAATAAMVASGADLDLYLDRVIAETGVAPGRCAVVGFSQGTMMALHVALRRDVAAAGIVGFSGRLLVPDALVTEIRSRPPVLLAHGDVDDVVPPASMLDAAHTLRGAGVVVLTHVMKGAGHGIAPDGLQVALAFLQDRLPAAG